MQEGRRTHPRYLVAGVVISLCEFDLPDGNDDALLEEKLHSCQDIVRAGMIATISACGCRFSPPLLRRLRRTLPEKIRVSET